MQDSLEQAAGLPATNTTVPLWHCVSIIREENYHVVKPRRNDYHIPKLNDSIILANLIA